jgi:hypothetical protein
MAGPAGKEKDEWAILLLTRLVESTVNDQQKHLRAIRTRRKSMRNIFFRRRKK